MQKPHHSGFAQPGRDRKAVTPRLRSCVDMGLYLTAVAISRCPQTPELKPLLVAPPFDQDRTSYCPKPLRNGT